MTCIHARSELVNEDMSSQANPKWGRVWRYQGPRGVVWRIRYQDATGRRVMETLGKEPAWDRKARRDRTAPPPRRRRTRRLPQAGEAQLRRLRERWLDEYLPGRGLKLTTTDSYRQTIHRHLLPAFGKHPLERLEREPELIDRYITAKTRAGLSPKTINNHLLVLQVMLKTAIRWRLIRHNPVSDIQRPRVEQPDLNVLTETEIAPPLDRLHPTRNRRGRRRAEAVVAARAHAHLRRARHRHAPRRTARPPLARRPTPRRPPARPRSARQRPLHHTQVTRRPPPHRPRPPHQHNSSPTTGSTAAYNGDDDLVFAHPTKGTPLDPARLAREYLKPALKAAGITQTVPALPRPPPHRPHPRSRRRQPPHLHPNKAGHSQAAITERYIHAAQVQFAGAAARAEARMFGR